MNNQRRRQLRVARGFLDNAREILVDVLDEEQNVYDHTPDNLQASEHYSQVEAAVDELTDAINSVDEASNSIERASE